MSTTAPVPPDLTDGRRARRERGRAAVIDAILSLFEGGQVSITTEQIAERAGVSVASVFRYFSSLEDLQRQALDRFFVTHASLFEVPRLGEGSPAERIQNFVEARLELYGSITGPARVARLRAPEFPQIAESLAATRSRLSAQVRQQFAPELTELSSARADDLAASIDVLTSFEAWDLLTVTHGRSRAQIRRLWTVSIERLLA